MGTSSSVELAPVFEKLTQWSWEKVVNVLKRYSEGDYDYSINYSTIMQITEMDTDDAKSVVTALSKNNAKLINAITFLTATICLADVNERQELRRINALFSLMDFNRMNQISVHDMTVLFICMSTAFYNVVVEPVSDIASDVSLITFTATLNEKLGRKDAYPISKKEFSDWAMNVLMVDMANGAGGGGTMTIDAIAGHLAVLQLQHETAMASAGLMMQAESGVAARRPNCNTNDNVLT